MNAEAAAGTAGDTTFALEGLVLPPHPDTTKETASSNNRSTLQRRFASTSRFGSRHTQLTVRCKKAVGFMGYPPIEISPAIPARSAFLVMEKPALNQPIGETLILRRICAYCERRPFTNV